MTFLTAMLCVFYFILALTGIGILFLLLDLVCKKYPLIGISILLIGGFLLVSFGVWTLGNL